MSVLTQFRLWQNNGETLSTFTQFSAAHSWNLQTTPQQESLDTAKFNRKDLFPSNYFNQEGNNEFRSLVPSDSVLVLLSDLAWTTSTTKGHPLSTSKT